MARPIAVVLQEFATLGAATVATPTQGVCLIGRCTVEVSKALNGSDAVLPYADISDTSPFSPPLAKPDMVITSATFRLVNAEVEIATVDNATANSDGVVTLSTGHAVQVGDTVTGVTAADEDTSTVLAVTATSATLSDAVTSGDDLVFKRVIPEIVLTQVNGSLIDEDTSQVALPTSPTVSVAQWDGVGTVTCDVLDAESVYVEYIADRYDMAESILEVTPANYTDTDKLGPATANNPLSLAAQVAFSNSGAQTIYCVGIAAGSDAAAADFTGVLPQLFSTPEIYALVPLCESHATAAAVATALRAELNNQASADVALRDGVAQRFRIAVVGGFSLEATSVPVSSKAATRVSASGNDVTFSSTTANFVSSGVVAGDAVVLSFSGNTYNGVVKTVITNQRIVVTSALAASGIADGASGTITSITHTKSYADKAAEAISLNGIDSRRVYLAWQPVSVMVGTTETQVGSQYLAAAVGGLVAGLPPHAAITNIGIGGVTKIRDNRYTEKQFTDISNAGLLVFKQDTSAGAPYCIHGVSSDKSGAVELVELSMVKVFDYTAAYFQKRQERFLSGWNVNDQTIGFIKSDLEIGIAVLKAQRYPKLGAVILDATLVAVAQNAAVTDKVESEILVTFPRPLNTLSLRIVSQ